MRLPPPIAAAAVLSTPFGGKAHPPSVEKLTAALMI